MTPDRATLRRSTIILCTGLAFAGATGAWSPAAADTPAAGTSAVQPAPAVSAEQTVPAAPVSENEASVAADDSATVEEGGSAPIDLFVNGTDEEGDSLALLGETSAAPAESPGPVLAPPHHDPMPVWPQPTVPPTADVVAPAPPVLAPPHIDPMPVFPESTVPPTPDVVEPASPVVTGPVVPTPAVVQPAAQSAMGPAALPDAQPAGKPAELAFTGDAVDVLLPIGAGLLLTGAGLARLGRRRPVQGVGAV